MTWGPQVGGGEELLSVASVSVLDLTTSVVPFDFDSHLSERFNTEYGGDYRGFAPNSVPAEAPLPSLPFPPLPSAAFMTVLQAAAGRCAADPLCAQSCVLIMTS